MLIKLYFYISSKHWKKLFFYLGKGYKFYGPIISTSGSGWLKRIDFVRWVDFYNFIFLVNELQLTKHANLNLVISKKKKSLKVINSLKQEEEKILPRKFGPRYKKTAKLKKKKKLLGFSIVQRKKKKVFNRLYITLGKNFMTYSFFEANFLSSANHKIGVLTYYLFCFSRIAILKILLFVCNSPFYIWSTKR